MQPLHTHTLQVALRRCSPLMIYALRRLARGLGSARAGARQGFATALALLLSRQVCGDGVCVCVCVCVCCCCCCCCGRCEQGRQYRAVV
jgi:hypothetical protein